MFIIKINKVEKLFCTDTNINVSVNIDTLAFTMQRKAIFVHRFSNKSLRNGYTAYSPRSSIKHLHCAQ